MMMQQQRGAYGYDGNDGRGGSNVGIAFAGGMAAGYIAAEMMDGLDGCGDGGGFNGDGGLFDF